MLNTQMLMTIALLLTIGVVIIFIQVGMYSSHGIAGIVVGFVVPLAIVGHTAFVALRAKKRR